MVPDIYWVKAVEPLRLALMPRPRSGDWLSDEILGWQRAGVFAVVSLLEGSEVLELGLGSEQSLCYEHGIEFVSFPIPDRATPRSVADTKTWVENVVTHLRLGRGVGIHCRAGIGRSALISGCVMHALGMPLPEIIPALTRARGMSVPDTSAQAEWLGTFAREASITL